MIDNRSTTTIFLLKLVKKYLDFRVKTVDCCTLKAARCETDYKMNCYHSCAWPKRFSLSIK